VPQPDRSSRRRELDGFGHGSRAASAALRGVVCVLSPHLDDAVLSLGASLASAARSGALVRIVTVFAGDPASVLPASRWDAKARFESFGQAVRARRAEDDHACRLLGATPVWLPFPDDDYGQSTDDDVLWEAIAPALADADVLLVPGFPLIHPDHLRVCRLVRARKVDCPVGYYVEQPYAAWLRSGFSTREPADEEIARLRLAWGRLRAVPSSWVTKVRAMRAYTSQMVLLHHPAREILGYELPRGGETVALPPERRA